MYPLEQYFSELTTVLRPAKVPYIDQGDTSQLRPGLYFPCPIILSVLTRLRVVYL